MNLAQLKQIAAVPENQKIFKESEAMYAGFIRAIGPKGGDSRAISIACIMLVSAALRDLPPELKVPMQEKFLKGFIKHSQAPFTYYKLGQ